MATGKRLLALYGTEQGHTAQIAAFVGAVAREAGWEADVLCGKDVPADFSLQPYAAALIAASVHDRRYEACVRDFVRAHRDALRALPCAFLSASLAGIGPKLLVERLAAAFYRETGWQPDVSLSVGGALLYRQYKPVQRQLMRLGSGLFGGPTDTSRDHDLTDWSAVRRFTRRFLGAPAEPAPPRPARG